MKLVINALFVPLALAVVTPAAAQAPSAAQKEMAVENFLQADANADGALNRTEFTTLINLNAEDGLGRAAMVRRFSRYDAAFGRMDANSDGFVTPEEMQALAEQARR